MTPIVEGVELKMKALKKKGPRPLPRLMDLCGLDKLMIQIARLTPELIPTLFRMISWSSRLMRELTTDRFVKVDEIAAVVQVGRSSARRLLSSSRRGFGLIRGLPERVPIRSIRTRIARRAFADDLAVLPAPAQRERDGGLSYLVGAMTLEQPALLPAVLALICQDDDAREALASHVPGENELIKIAQLDATGAHLVDAYRQRRAMGAAG